MNPQRTADGKFRYLWLVRVFLAAGPALFLLITSMTTPADACLFVGINPVRKETSATVRSRGFGATEKRACRRAERTCLRKLKAVWKNSKAQHFACKRID